MFKIEYIPFIGIISSILIFYSDLNFKKTRTKKNVTLIKHLENWSSKITIKGKERDKLEALIFNSGLDIKVEAFKLIQYLLPIIVFLIIILIKYTNILNSILNIEQLKEVAKYLNDESFAVVDTKIEYTKIFLISLVFYFVPIGFLKIIACIKDMESKEEVLMLQTYALMMLKTDLSVQGIIEVLYKRSKIFKPYLQKAVNGYSQDPQKTLKELKKVKNEGFEKIIIALEQALIRDRETSFDYIKKKRTLTKDINRIEKRTKDTKKKIIGLLMLVIPLIIFTIIGGYPWLMLSLKSMNDLNF